MSKITYRRLPDLRFKINYTLIVLVYRSTYSLKKKQLCSLCYFVHVCFLVLPSNCFRWIKLIINYIQSLLYICIALVFNYCLVSTFIWDFQSINQSIIFLFVSVLVWCSNISVGAQSTLGGTIFLPEKYVKNYQICPNFTRFLSEKLSK